MAKQYKLLADHYGMPAGTIVHEFQGVTYGLCSDDTRYSGGRKHIPVTEHKDQAPFLSTPLDILEEVPCP